MNIVDFVILVVAAVAAIDGFRRGAAVTAGQYVGLFAGLVLGATVAPHIIDRLDVTNPGTRAAVAAMAAFTGAAVGMFAGTAVSDPIRRALSRFAVTSFLDGAAGTVVSLAVALAVALTLARSLALGPNYAVASAVQQSSVVQELNDIAPSQPAFLAHFEQALSNTVGSAAFAGLEPALPSALRIDPSSARSAAVLAAAGRVVKIEGQGCGGILSGSGFPIGPTEVLTNAHVVAGTERTVVQRSDGERPLRATVILFDSARDVAVLQVPGLNMTPFDFSDSGRGTQGAVIGYPGGGDERVTSGVINGPMTAHGYDIYNSDAVTREVLVVGGDIEPGNSGGPFVDEDGNVAGVVFARSLSTPGQGFALSPAEIQPDLDSLAAGAPVFDAGRERCAG